MIELRRFLAAPVVVPQALWVRARADQMPEAAGAREGVAGRGAPRRLLMIGDSSAAGVGVAHQDEALLGQTVARLALAHEVSYRLIARSGATTACVLDMLEDEDLEAYDDVVISLGTNDAKNGVPQVRFEANYRRVIDRVATGEKHQTIVVSGLPPVGKFSTLPRPLRSVVGDRVDAFDRFIEDVALDYDCTYFLPLDFTLHAPQMAPDRFHPGPLMYSDWASRIVSVLRRDVQQVELI